MSARGGLVKRFLLDGKWHTAPEICQACGFTDSRPIREMAETTGAIIGGPRGYKRADLATAEELAEAARGLESRVRKIARRAKKTRAWIPRPPERQVSFW